MGIELELHSGRPAGRGPSRDTVLRGSYEHGDALASALSTLDRRRPSTLGRVDPYGDTVFDAVDARVARQEATVLVRECADAQQREALLDLVDLLEACEATPGSYLWFMGD